MAWYYWLWIATSTLAFLTFFLALAVRVSKPEGKSSGITLDAALAILLFLMVATIWPLFVGYRLIKKLSNHG
jgi:hypothetical protein